MRRSPDLEALDDARPVLFDLKEGGWLSSKAPEANHFHPGDPFLFELGWRAWFWLMEEMDDGPPRGWVDPI